MTRLTLGQKAERVLKFLMGLRHQRAIAALMKRGFRSADLDEGWTLLRGVAHVRFDATPATPADPTVISDLDQWENTWFPVAEATLRRSYPAIADRVFLNLSQTDGPAVILSVGTLVERLSVLASAKDAESAAAYDRLSQRGLNEQTIEQARLLLQRAQQIEPQSVPPDLDAEDEEAERAENLWAWYLEWSQIARSAITDRNLLRSLGFLSQQRHGGADDIAPADA